MNGIQPLPTRNTKKPEAGEIWLDRFGGRWEIVTCGNKYAVIKEPGSSGRETTTIHVLGISKEPPYVAPTPVATVAIGEASTTPSRPSDTELDKEFLSQK